MIAMEIPGYLLVGVFVSFAMMRWWFARKARRAEGQTLAAHIAALLR